MMKKWINCIVFFLGLMSLEAQDFCYQADVEQVTEKGYYKIVLSPELLGLVNTNHSDVRLYDAKGNEQPYIIEREPASSLKSTFVTYEIVERMFEKDTVSHLIFHNPEKRKINNVSFVVRNTAVHKRVKLSGSDDKQNWYIIKNDYLLHSVESGEKTTELRMLNFPLSDYTYFKLEVNDKSDLPINIIEVGFYDTQKAKGTTTSFPIPVESQVDSAKHSYIKLAMQDTMYVEQLAFELSGAEYYSRTVKLMDKREYFSRKKKKIVDYHTIGSGSFNSNTNPVLYVKKGTAKELYLEIDNQDNPPLKVDKVTGSILNTYLIAELKPNKEYRLKFGNDNLRKPQYDLVKFRKKLKVDSKPLAHSSVITTKKNETLVKEQISVFENPYFVWVTIGLVGAVLAFISFKMLREIGGKT